MRIKGERRRENEERQRRRKRCHDNDPRTPPPLDLPSFTAAEIRGPTLLIYRYLDTYMLTGVVF